MFLTLFKKITGFDPTAIFIGIMLVVIAAVLIPNYDRVMGFFGYETRTVLKEKLETANNNTEVAVNVNKSNEGTIAVLEDTVKNTEQVIDSKVKEDKAVLKFTTEIKVKKDKKIEVIIAQPDKPQAEIDKEVSDVHITSLWTSYCDFNQNQQCAANTSGSS